VETDDTPLAIGLGLVQGVTEFLPISSDGHLALFALLFKIESASLALTVLLHVGTLLATALVLRADLASLARATLSGLRHPVSFARTPEGELLLKLALASVPTAVIGLLLERYVEALTHDPWTVGAGFLGSALAVSSTRGRVDGSDTLGWGSVMMVGLVQGLAVLPGLSRSGVTIAWALALGMSAPAAFRFSFLLSLPAVAGAALLELSNPDVLAGFAPGAWLGALVAFITGYVALRLVRGLLVRDRFWLFAVYLVPLSAVMLGWEWIGHR
jgi:undecaprenyl-diphosphatase